MHYTQVNIGRNINSKPMTQEKWEEFQAHVYILMSDCAIEPNLEIHNGYGHWDGMVEESTHISMLSEDIVDLDRLRDGLVDLKKEYGQDTIALITGSELV